MEHPSVTQIVNTTNTSGINSWEKTSDYNVTNRDIEWLVMLRERWRDRSFLQRHLLEAFILFLMSPFIEQTQMGILGVTLSYSETVAHVSYGIITIKASRNTEEKVLF